MVSPAAGESLPDDDPAMPVGVAAVPPLTPGTSSSMALSANLPAARRSDPERTLTEAAARCSVSDWRCAVTTMSGSSLDDCVSVAFAGVVWAATGVVCALATPVPPKSAA